ncbi:uncharacterized protein ACB057_015059 [Neosynchiropus ocellatus]
MKSPLFLGLLPLLLIPSVASLFCYTCVFPAVSPADCITFPLNCPPGQICLSSKAEGEKGVATGDYRVVLYERSCVLPSLCGVTGSKFAMGLNFTFTNECCNTHLCNGAATNAAGSSAGTLLTLLMVSHTVW